MLAHTTEAKAALTPLEQLDRLQLSLYGKVRKLISEQTDPVNLLPEINQLNETILLLCKDPVLKTIPEVKQIDTDAYLRWEILLKLQSPDEEKRGELFESLRPNTEYYPLDAAWLEEPQKELPKIERVFTQFFTYLDEQKVQPQQLTTAVAVQPQPQPIRANNAWDIKKFVVNEVFSFFSNKELTLNRGVSRYWNNEVNSPLRWKARLKKDFGIVVPEAKNVDVRHYEMLCHRLPHISNSPKELLLYKMIIHSGIYFPPLHWVAGEEKTHLTTHLPPLQAAAGEQTANLITRRFYYQAAKELKNTAFMKWLEAQDPSLQQQNPVAEDVEAKSAEDTGLKLDHLRTVGDSVLGLKGIDQFRELNAAIQKAGELFDEFMTRDMTLTWFNKNNDSFLATLKANLLWIGFHVDNFEFVKWLISPERHHFQCRFGAGYNSQFIEKPHYIQLLPADSEQKKDLMLRIRFRHYSSEGRWECLDVLLQHFTSHLDYETYLFGVKTSLSQGHYETAKELMLDTKGYGSCISLICSSDFSASNVSLIYEDMLKQAKIDAAAWLQPQLSNEDLQQHRIYHDFPLQSLEFMFGLHEKSKKETAVKMTLKILAKFLSHADKEPLVERMLNENRIVEELKASTEVLVKLAPGQFDSIVKNHIFAWYRFKKIDAFVKIMDIIGLKVDYDLFLSVTKRGNLKLMMLILSLPQVYNAYVPMQNFEDNGDKLFEALMGVIRGEIHSVLGLLGDGLVGQAITSDNDLSALCDFYNKVIFKYIEDTVEACKQNELVIENTDKKWAFKK